MRMRVRGKRLIEQKRVTRADSVEDAQDEGADGGGAVVASRAVDVHLVPPAQHLEHVEHQNRHFPVLRRAQVGHLPLPQLFRYGEVGENGVDALIPRDVSRDVCIGAMLLLLGRVAQVDEGVDSLAE